MIVEWVLKIGQMLLYAIISLLDVLPDMPPVAIEAIDYVVTLMEDAASLVFIFLDINMVKILIPVVIAIINFDRIVKFVMFILRKIPFLGVE